ncbi:Alanine racemase [Chlamydiales bacterium SCGC AG-110-P3]|nr:Alanine racemase [Chlamydiales bacterium SCGC AG-110-P3]
MQNTDTMAAAENSSSYIIDLSAVHHNIATIKKHLPTHTRLMMMVKADGYGTGAVTTTQFATDHGIDIAGVTHIDEAIVLRHAGIESDIFVLHATTPDIDKLLLHRVEVAVSNIAFLHALARAAHSANTVIKVHVHLDSGMTRLGASMEEAITIASEAHRLSDLQLEGLMTHFPSADDPTQDAFTRSQGKMLSQLVSELAGRGITVPWIHAANSAGALRFDFPFCNMVRLGIAAYGVLPSSKMKSTLPLKCALSLSAPIVGINYPSAGTTVSYSRQHVVRRDNARIGVIPLGYHDGIHRRYAGTNSVFIDGVPAPMVGAICMDYFMVDLTDHPQTSIGSRALIFGCDGSGSFISPETFAEQGGTIPHELMTCIGPRVPRIHIRNNKMS